MQVTLNGSNASEGIADFGLNTQGTLAASAARTTPLTTATQTNKNAKGVMVTLNVTAVGTGGLNLRIMAVDPVTGTAIALNATGTAVTATGEYAYLLYPGLATSGPVATTQLQQTTNAVLPRQWYVLVQTADGSSYTYSVGYSLIL